MKEHKEIYKQVCEDRGQPKIETALKGVEPYPPNHPKRIFYNKRLVFVLAKDLQPYNMVKREGFRILVAGFDPRYTLPARQTIRNVLVPKVN